MFKLLEKEVLAEWERHLSEKFNVSVIHTNINECEQKVRPSDEKSEHKPSKKARHLMNRDLSWVIEMTQKRELCRYFKHQELTLCCEVESQIRRREKSQFGATNRSETIISSKDSK